jgi:hypothetical protein
MIAIAKLHAKTPKHRRLFCQKKDFSGLWKQTLPKSLFFAALATPDYRLMLRSKSPLGCSQRELVMTSAILALSGLGLFVTCEGDG